MQIRIRTASIINQKFEPVFPKEYRQLPKQYVG